MGLCNLPVQFSLFGEVAFLFFWIRASVSRLIDFSLFSLCLCGAPCLGSGSVFISLLLFGFSSASVELLCFGSRRLHSPGDRSHRLWLSVFELLWDLLFIHFHSGFVASGQSVVALRPPVSRSSLCGLRSFLPFLITLYGISLWVIHPFSAYSAWGADMSTRSHLRESFAFYTLGVSKVTTIMTPDWLISGDSTAVVLGDC